MNLKEMLKEAIKKMTSLKAEVSMRSKVSRLRSRQQKQLMR